MKAAACAKVAAPTHQNLAGAVLALDLVDYHPIQSQPAATIATAIQVTALGPSEPGEHGSTATQNRRSQTSVSKTVGWPDERKT